MNNSLTNSSSDSTGSIGSTSSDDSVIVVSDFVTYNVILWSPFIAIPLLIILGRIARYLYKIYEAHVYGYGTT